MHDSEDIRRLGYEAVIFWYHYPYLNNITIKSIGLRGNKRNMISQVRSYISGYYFKFMLDNQTTA